MTSLPSRSIWILAALLAFISSSPTSAQTLVGAVNIGSSASLTVSVRVPVADTLTGISVLTGGATGLDFTNGGGGTCVVGSAYAAGCTVQVTFTPRLAGPRSGAVVVTDSKGVVATVYLRGTGIGPQLAFGPTAAPTLLPFTLIGLPTAVAVDANGAIYVGDNGDLNGPISSNPGGRVLKETPSANGGYTQTVVASGFYSPQSILIDGAGNLYIHDVGNGATNSHAIYKEVLANGVYTQTVAGLPPSALGLSGPGQTTVAVDGAGNLYYLSKENVGVASPITVSTLQPDGTYLPNQTLPFPTASSVISNTSCGMVRTDSVAVDGNGLVSFTAYLECASGGAYTTAFGMFAYTNGNSQPPVAFAVATIPYVQPTYLPPAQNLFAESRGGLFQWITYDANRYFSEILPTSTSYTYRASGNNLGTITPYSVSVDDAGNQFYTDAGHAQGGSAVFTGGGVYRQGFSAAPTLSFATTSKGVISTDSPKFVIVENVGTTALNLTSVAYPADFPAGTSQTQSVCTGTSSLAPNNTCQFSVTFVPAIASSTSTNQLLTEAVVFGSNVGTARSIPVTGSVLPVAPTVATPAFSPAAGTYTATQTVSITDSTAGLTIYYTLDGSTPTVSSTKYTAPLNISTSQTVKAIGVLTGSTTSAIATAAYVIALPADYTFTVSPPSITINGGSSGIVTATITPLNGFTGTTSFSCSGLPLGATCSFAPAAVTPSGTTAISTAITISVPASLGLVSPPSLYRLPEGVLLALLIGLGLRARRRKVNFTLFPILVVSAFALTAISGCSAGSNSNGTKGTPVNATINVTATSGALQHSANVSLYVP